MTALFSYRWMPIGLGLALILLAVVPTALPAAKPTTGESQPSSDLKQEALAGFVGVGSCASSACHNGNFSKGRRGETYAKRCEYSVWIRDPHSKAYADLFQERSRIIERDYRKVDLKDSHPEADLLCLQCHVDPALKTVPDPAPPWFADGVGCESCHGAAKKWLVPHISEDWKALTALDKQKLGFIPTQDLGVQAASCMECHVGSGRCEVNHDLIAAGHPRLNYEHSDALAKLPKHWDADEERRRNPEYDIRVWELGQTYAARQALFLLATRAKRAEGKSAPWPELAEYDCYACHHDLAKTSFRQTKNYVGDPPRLGALSLNNWYFAGQDSLIRPLIEAMGKTHPDPKAVYAEALKVGQALEEKAAELASRPNGDAAILRSRLESLTDPPADEWEGYTWDQAFQRALAIRAHYRGLASLERRSVDPQAGRQIEEFLNHFRFPPLQDSPRGYDPRKLAKELEAIHSQLGQR